MTMNRMRTILLSALAVVAVCLTACAQTKEKKEMNGKKVLVVYFSATGTTKDAARKVASATGGELYEILPEQPYTSADLNWQDRQSRSSMEMNNPASRPAIKSRKADIADYDIIFIGYPVWWDLAPRAVNTFIESHDLKGKTVIPFATSGGSGIGNSVTQLKKEYPEIRWHNGRLLNTASEKSVREWIEKCYF